MIGANDGELAAAAAFDDGVVTKSLADQLSVELAESPSVKCRPSFVYIKRSSEGPR